MEFSRINTDVLVIGGGLAGLNAAIAAAEKGAQVVVMDKGKIERSGSIGGGVDHLGAWLNSGPAWDTREAWLENAWRIGKGTAHLSILDATVCDELAAALDRLERLGVPLRQPDGTYLRTQAFGQPGPTTINFNGKRMKPALAKEVRRLGCRVLDRVMTVTLITQKGVVAGALGFHIRSGEPFLIEAKATIIATGSTNRITQNPRMNAFNTWQCPLDTGDGQVMAFNAGAALTNMEYMRITIVPKGFSAAGLGAFTAMGGRFLNAKGEYYMEKNYPAGNKAPRNQIVFQTLKEIQEGRGPVFIDCTHVTGFDARHLATTLGYDKDTLPDYLAQRGEDITKRPLAVDVSEGLQCGPTNETGSGVKIDRHCASTVPGLFAGGDAADHHRCVRGCVTGGFSAGKGAADYALKTNAIEIDPTPLRDAFDSFMAPLRRKTGLSYGEMEEVIGKVVSEHMAVGRTEMGLNIGFEKLKGIESHIGLLKAENFHELMRANETRSILQVAKIMNRAAEYRKESRIKPYHYRLDYSETDDQNWCGLVVVEKDGEGIRLSFDRTVHG